MIAIGLFGSELTIKDGFSRVFSSFIGQATSAKSSVNGLTGEMRNAEAASANSVGSMRSQVASLAQEYKKAGLSQSEAFRKAWSEVERSSNNAGAVTGKTWATTFRKIKNDGSNAFGSLSNSISNFSNSTLGTLSKLTAGYLSLKGAADLTKESLKAGMTYQNASTFLQATYGETKGKEKFKWATQEANKTPFTESEVASSLARAHALGLKDDEKSFKMYEDMGSFAKIQGVGDLSSAVDAISDALGGEWERLQTITGIKRQGLEDYAKTNGLGKFTNKKGQVTDKDKLMEVLESYMGEKGISGMTDKFSKTLSGRLSTLKGNWEKTLADMVGIGDDGAIKDGSLFDNASKGLEKLITSVNKFSKSESFDKIADGLGKLGNGLIGGLDYITMHPETVKTLTQIGVGLLGLKVASGVISPIVKLTGGLATLGGVSNSLPGILNKATLSIGVFAIATNSFFGENGVLHKVANGMFNIFTPKDNKIDVPAASKSLLKSSANGWNYIYEKIMGNDEADNNYKNNEIKNLAESERADAKLNGVSDNTYTWDAATRNKYKNLYAYEQFYNHDDSYEKYKSYSEWNTIPSMLNNKEISNTINNTSTNSHASNKTEINLNVDTIKETADINDIMDQIANKLNKLNNTRNAVNY